MKKKLSSLHAYYKLHPKRFWALGIILVLVLIYMFTRTVPSTVTVTPVAHSDLKQTILATGQVTSNTDLSLSFPMSGLVSSLPVSVGDKVYRGQVLAMLENRNEYAALKNAQANYQKVIDGNSNEEVAVAQAALETAKSSLDSTQKVQDTLVENAHRALLNADLTPILTSGTTTTPPTVTGTYKGSIEGSYTIKPYGSANSGYFAYSGTETGTGLISTNAPVAIGTSGLYIQFPSTYTDGQGNVWTILLPNTKSVNYLTAYNAYQNALKNHDSAISAANAAVVQAEANLNLKKAAARPADVAVAQAQVDAARATYDRTVLVAPAAGTVVHVDTKIGERADAAKEVVVIQDVGNLYVEANINETSIAKIALDQQAVMTLDAFGPTTFFNGKVIHIDPSSTTEGGVVNYVIKTSIESSCKDTADCAKAIDVVRPGMNANIVITAWNHPNVIALPKAAVTTEADGTSTVKISLDDKNKKTETRKVTLGMTGDGNLVEITSGLSDGDKVLIGK